MTDFKMTFQNNEQTLGSILSEFAFFSVALHLKASETHLDCLKRGDFKVSYLSNFESGFLGEKFLFFNSLGKTKFQEFSRFLSIFILSFS